MADVKVKFKMTAEQFTELFNEWKDTSIPNRPYFLSFQEFLNWKFSDLIDSKIDEVIKNA